MQVGVLAMQGAFREHREAFARLGSGAREIRKPADLEGVEALVLPGGESTTIGKLLVDFGLLEPVREMAARGVPFLGTCAGLVLLAREIRGSQQPRLGLLDIAVLRNGYGRQVESFEADLEIPALGEAPFRGVFIRAPLVEAVGPGVEVLATFAGKPVLVRQGNLLAASFHPELTSDLRLHSYFLGMAGRE